MSEHDKLVSEAADAMRRNGRRPELAVLRALSDEMLRDIIARHQDPFYVLL